MKDFSGIEELIQFIYRISVGSTSYMVKIRSIALTNIHELTQLVYAETSFNSFRTGGRAFTETFIPII